MLFHFETVRKAIHAMLNDVVENGFKHSLEFPSDKESAHKVIEDANTSLRDIMNAARKNDLIPNSELKQKAFTQTLKQAEKSSLTFLSEIQLLRRRQIMTLHKLNKSDLFPHGKKKSELNEEDSDHKEI